VLPDIKFCGMTREEDVDAAVALGARYIGVIFAGGPRSVTLERAREVLASVPARVSRVGVFGPEISATSGETAQKLGLDVMQIHGDPDEAAIGLARESFGGAIWAALRISGPVLPGRAAGLFRIADAVVLDAYSQQALGGTGKALPWSVLSNAVAAVRQPGRLVLAGGLRPENVSTAVHALRPDIVDVSSGVESAPGIKDHTKLRAFRDAVRGEGGAA
jgi:phosphoribosylanthranilate isomerase